MSDITLSVNPQRQRVVSLEINRIPRPTQPEDPGTSPSDGQSLTFVQTQAEAVWVINHSFSYPPVVVIIDSAGSQVYGSVEYSSPSQVIVSFSAPFSGRAVLS